MSLSFEPIGIIRTPYPDLDDTPVQTRLNWDTEARIELDPAYREALAGLDEFSHLWVLTWLHRPGQPTGASAPMRQVPFLLRPTGIQRGVFAMRGPRRPNPIGLHLVRLVSVVEDPPTIAFSGVDMADGTPVLDIKPWVERFDWPEGDTLRSGWYDDLEIRHNTPSELGKGKNTT